MSKSNLKEFILNIGVDNLHEISQIPVATFNSWIYTSKQPSTALIRVILFYSHSYNENLYNFVGNYLQDDNKGEFVHKMVNNLLERYTIYYLAKTLHVNANTLHNWKKIDYITNKKFNDTPFIQLIFSLSSNSNSFIRNLEKTGLIDDVINLIMK